jgi:glutamyl-tRNA reductase
MEAYLAKADIVLVSTGSREYILDRERLKPVLKKRKYQPLFVIDISVPRNVDPLVNEMENVFLYDIDDLQSVIESNLDERRREAEIAEEIVDEEVVKFFQRLSRNQLGPLISELRTRVEELCLEDLKKSRNGMAPEVYEQAERMLLRAAHKVAHPLIVGLKETQQRPGQQIEKIEMFKQIFSLDKENE